MALTTEISLTGKRQTITCLPSLSKTGEKGSNRNGSSLLLLIICLIQTQRTLNNKRFTIWKVGSMRNTLHTAILVVEIGPS